MTLALEEMNANSRRHYEVAIEDNASQNAGSVNALNKLAGRGDIVAILAPIRSSTQVLAIPPRINEVGVPTLTGRNQRNDHQARQPLDFPRAYRRRTRRQARSASRGGRDGRRRRIGILHDVDAFGTGGLRAFSKALADMYGIAPVIVEQFQCRRS